jgi:hypothetical protein
VVSVNAEKSPSKRSTLPSHIKDDDEELEIIVRLTQESELGEGKGGGGLSSPRYGWE